MKSNNAFRRSFSVFGAAYKGLWQVRALVWLGVVLVMGIAISGVFFSDQSAAFAFSKQQCLTGLVVLPSQQVARSGTQSSVSYQNAIAVAGVPILARGVCYNFQSAPTENKNVTISHSLFGLGLFAKKISFFVGEYPKLVTNQLPATISTAKPLQFSLSAPDNFFDYSLKSDNATAPCQTVGEEINCDVKELSLEHSKTYQLALSQSFNNTVVGTVATMRAITASPVTLASESILSGATIYDVPSQLTLSADRQLQSADTITMTSKVGAEASKPVAVTTKLSGKKIIVTWAEPLPRQAELVLSVNSAGAPDGGTLLAPFTATYKTSGGPRVVGVNIRDRAVPLSTRIVLNLDQELKSGQNLSTLFGVKVGGVVVPSLVTVSGRNVTIIPAASFALCTVFQVWAADGVLSTSGVSGGSSWAYNSRSTCATVFSIGTSVKGRAITAYKFGSGANTILFNGNLHGNESNTKRLLDAWINELQGNPGRIPAGKTIVIIPLSSPDGYAAGTRTNANNVDLNRNFAANNWKSTVKMPSGETLATGGGVSAHSEPESQALVNYIGNLGPSLVMSYHSKGNVVVANDAGNSWNLTKTYSNKSGYGAENGATIGNFFDYDTTGAFEDWLHDKKGIAAILVELATRESDEFSRNKNAMWQMVFDF